MIYQLKLYKYKHTTYDGSSPNFELAIVQPKMFTIWTHVTMASFAMLSLVLLARPLLLE
jgi:hypothetical protein